MIHANKPIQKVSKGQIFFFVCAAGKFNSSIILKISGVLTETGVAELCSF